MLMGYKVCMVLCTMPNLSYKMITDFKLQGVGNLQGEGNLNMNWRNWAVQHQFKWL